MPDPHLLPDAISFAQLKEDPRLAAELARIVCDRHHLSGPCTRLEEGSSLVFGAAGNRIVKIFAREDADFFRAERVFLDSLHGRLPIRTPALEAAGAWNGFPYIVMEQLPGAMLGRVWDAVSARERRQILDRLGVAARALHALPTGLFEDAPFRWEPFIAGQRASIAEIHRRFGLEESWLAQIPAYLDACGTVLFEESRLVPLHTELMPEHLFVQKGAAGWALSGLIDFEPSMVGRPEYEFCAVGLFVTRGDRALFRRFLSAYGYPDAEISTDLSRRIMAFLLLHRYGTLHRFLGRLPAGGAFTTLHDLEDHWYGA